jgi:hypothetical protein
VLHFSINTLRRMASARDVAEGGSTASGNPFDALVLMSNHNYARHATKHATSGIRRVRNRNISCEETLRFKMLTIARFPDCIIPFRIRKPGEQEG